MIRAALALTLVAAAGSAWVPTVHAAGPATTITSGPPSLTNQTSASFTFEASGALSYACSLDGGGFSGCSSGKSFEGLGDGGHTFAVRATSIFLQTGPEATHSWTVDTAPPTTVITSGPSGTVGKGSVSFAFSSPDGGTAFGCELDGGGFSPCTSGVSYPALGDGTHQLHVRATDAAGNTGSAATRGWTVDAAPPSLSVPGTIVAEADRPSGAPVSFTVSGTNDGAAVVPSAISCSPSSGSTFGLGTTTVRCRTSDALGNEASAEFDVVVRDTTPPVINAPDVEVTATGSRGIAKHERAVDAYLSAVKATDLVSAATLTNDLPDVLPLGKTVVAFTARDAAGNVASMRAIVTVLPVGRRAAPLDVRPPAELVGVRAEAGDRRVILRWRKPPRDVDHITVTVRREGAGGAPRVSRSVGRQVIVGHLVNGVTYRVVVVTWDKARNRSKGVVLRATPVRELLSNPKASERVTRPPVLRWAPTRGAGYYNVQLWRGSAKVLSAWPTRPRLQLTVSWVFDGASRKLTPGVYRWYVWPGLGAKADARYGPMLGTRVFVVVAPPV